MLFFEFLMRNKKTGYYKPKSGLILNIKIRRKKYIAGIIDIKGAHSHQNNTK